MGIVAHPNEVTSLAVSFDGRFLFSAGGFDLSVNMWKIDVEEHRRGRERAAALLAGDGEDGGEVPIAVHNSVEAAALRPYFSLLEGGEGGELHNDIIDYFYYCQLRTLGEDSMETRKLTGEIKKALDELGLHHKCASVRAIEVPPDNQNLLSGKEEDVFPLLEAAGRRAIEDDGAEVLILGSTTMHQSHAYLSARLPVPVINPGPLSYKLAESMMALGLRHSRVGYPAPMHPRLDMLQHMLGAAASFVARS